MRDLLSQLLTTGSHLYGTSATTECAETYRRAGEVARALGDRDSELSACFWEGCALHGGGELRAALAVMAPALTARDASFSDGEIYRIATRYLRALVELPIERSALDNSIEEVEERLIQAGRGEWRSRTLILRARLALSTGEWPKARAIALQAIEAKRSDPFGLSHSSYHWLATLLSIWLGELDGAARLLESWRPLEPGRVSQLVYRPWLRSCWLRRNGQAPDGLAHARDAHAEALANGEYPEQFTAAVELTRVLLTLGDIGAARAQLRELLRFRATEMSEHAYVIRVLVGDQHVARARALAGLNSVDLEFHHAYEPRVRASARAASAPRSELARARRAYALAGRRGASLDRLYDCQLRAWQMSDRLAAVERAENEIG